MFTINCRGRLHVFETPQVMGILNITPDSFYEGFEGMSADELRSMAGRMIADGASILDIGGQSTRPGSERVDDDTEWNRIKPVLNDIRRSFPDIILSVDTYHASVARRAVEAGADIINDISFGCMDADMIDTVASLGVPFIGMHMKGRPETMQQNTTYGDMIAEILDFFSSRIASCEKAGIKDIIIDPGFGFGKSIAQNMELLRRLGDFKITDKPLLAGLSRKSTIYRTLGTDAAGALNGTTVVNTLALLNGADILRVHDPKEAREAVILTESYKKAAPTGAA